MPDDSPLFAFQDRTANFLSRDQMDLYHEEKRGDSIVQMASAKRGRGVVYADAGLGKSRMVIETFIRMHTGKSPILIIGSKNSQNTWRRELLKWTDITEDEITFVEGSPTQRITQWRNPTRVMIAKYASCVRDLPHILSYLQRLKTDTIFWDEAHRLRNRKSKAFILAKKLCQRVPYVLFVSGTLITRGPQDLWTYMHLCDPKRFPSFWKFIYAFCNVIETPFGQEIAGPKNTKSISREFARHLVRLRDKDPEIRAARPPFTRDVVPITPTKKQMRMHDGLLEQLFTVTDEGHIIAAPSGMSVSLKLRQLMVCPKILDPALEWGSNIEFILGELEEDPHIVIFTPFRPGVTLLQDAIMAAGHPPPLYLWGGSSPDDVKRVEEEFDNPKNADRAYVGTTQFAESFELPSARQCLHNGFDWSQLVNYQAEKRLHRLTTPHPVVSKYLVGHNTVEEWVIAVLNRKQRNANITLQDYIDVLAQRRGKLQNKAKRAT